MNDCTCQGLDSTGNACIFRVAWSLVQPRHATALSTKRLTGRADQASLRVPDSAVARAVVAPADGHLRSPPHDHAPQGPHDPRAGRREAGGAAHLPHGLPAAARRLHERHRSGERPPGAPGPDPCRSVAASTAAGCLGSARHPFIITIRPPHSGLCVQSKSCRTARVRILCDQGACARISFAVQQTAMSSAKVLAAALLEQLLQAAARCVKTSICLCGLQLRQQAMICQSSHKALHCITTLCAGQQHRHPVQPGQARGSTMSSISAPGKPVLCNTNLHANAIIMAWPVFQGRQLRRLYGCECGFRPCIRSPDQLSERFRADHSRV